jgi:acyl-coenzyme A thioesterase PaaI-like protein
MIFFFFIYLYLAKEYKHWVKDHALHDTVAGPGKVEAYEIYQKNNSNELYCLVKFGKSLNGHPGIVHGGITSLVFDNTFGWLFLALKIKPAFTANLVINYRSPVYANTCCILKAKLLKFEGRKLYMNATLEDTNGKLLAESTTLFITMKENFSTFLQKTWFDLKRGSPEDARKGHKAARDARTQGRPPSRASRARHGAKGFACIVAPVMTMSSTGLLFLPATGAASMASSTSAPPVTAPTIE